MNERGGIITNPMEIKKTISKYYKQLYHKKLDNLDDMGKCLERHRLPNCHSDMKARQRHHSGDYRPISLMNMDTTILKIPHTPVFVMVML